MAELLQKLIRPLVGLLITIAGYFSGKSKNKIDDKAVKVAEENQELIAEQLMKLAAMLKKQKEETK